MAGPSSIGIHIKMFEFCIVFATSIWTLFAYKIVKKIANDDKDNDADKQQFIK